MPQKANAQFAIRPLFSLPHDAIPGLSSLTVSPCYHAPIHIHSSMPIHTGAHPYPAIILLDLSSLCTTTTCQRLRMQAI